MRTLAIIFAVIISIPICSLAAERVGTVVAARATSTAINLDGAVRTLSRGLPILEGDTLKTDKSGRLQVLFKDQAMFSFESDSEFSVDRYAYEPSDTSKTSAALELIKGGLRTFSGAISKAAPENFQIKASITTIGIRGTNYTIRICDDACSARTKSAKGVVGTVIDGTISVRTNKGTKLVKTNRFFFADMESGVITVSKIAPAALEISSAGSPSRQNMSGQKGLIKSALDPISRKPEELPNDVSEPPVIPTEPTTSTPTEPTTSTPTVPTTSTTGTTTGTSDTGTSAGSTCCMITIGP